MIGEVESCRGAKFSGCVYIQWSPSKGVYTMMK